MAEETRPTSKAPAARSLRMLTDEVLDGLDLADIKCRACSGYGNCGYKSHFLMPEGKGVASICMRTRDDLIAKRDGASKEGK